MMQTETGKRSLRPEDLVLHDRKIDYGMKAQNPLEHASFFKDWSDTTSYRCKGHEISSMLPENFSERKVRVFVKDSSKVEQAKNAFDNWRAKNLKSNQKVNADKEGVKGGEDGEGSKWLTMWADRGQAQWGAMAPATEQHRTVGRWEQHSGEGVKQCPLPLG